MKVKFLYFLPAVILALFIASCDTIQQASYDDTGVGGVVTDSATHLPIQNAEVLLLPDGTRTYTDSLGNFYIGKIHVPTSAGNYWLNVYKPGYDTAKFFVILYAGDTTRRVSFSLFQGSQEVYVNYHINVTEFLNSHSQSSLNLYDLATIEDTNVLYRDMRLRDSASTRQVFSFLSGWDYTSGNGWQTRFTSLIGNYTHEEFDTLSTLFGGRPLNPNSDFPFDGTNSFSVPSVSNMVFGYYLLGRHNYSGDPYIYGLLRIADAYVDTNSGTVIVVIDLKVNRKGNNYFRIY